MGGQVADHGVIKNAKGELLHELTDVQNAPNGQDLHTVDILAKLVVGDNLHT